MLISKYLKIYEKDNKYFVYHTMYGNLTKLNEKAYKLLMKYKSENQYTDQETMVIHQFIDNFFINESESEELEIFENAKAYRKLSKDGRLLVGLQLVMSNYCNFNCRYCFLNEEHKLRDNSQANAPSNMTFEVAKKSIDFMVDNIKKNGNGVLSIEFFGGEPLMNWTVIKEVLDFYGQNYNEIEMDYTITTNGSLITDEMISYFEKYKFLVIVSYDSPSSTERLTKNNKELNEVLFPIFNKMRNKAFNKSFNSVISRYTLENYDFKGLIDLAKEYEIENIGLILDLDADFLEIGYSLDDVANIILETYWYGRSKGINVTGYWEKMYLQINNMDDLYYIKGYKACPALGCKISIEPSGDIFACKCCPTKIGEIYGFDALLNDNRYEEYVKRIDKNADSCDNCELRSFCSGVCIGALEKLGSKYGQNAKLCYLYKKITKELIFGCEEEIPCIELEDQK